MDPLNRSNTLLIYIISVAVPSQQNGFVYDSCFTNDPYSIRDHISIDRILCLIVIVNVLSFDWPVGHFGDGRTTSVMVPRTVLVNSLYQDLA